MIIIIIAKKWMDFLKKIKTESESEESNKIRYREKKSREENLKTSKKNIKNAF